MLEKLKQQPNNRQKQTKNMKNITQKFRFRLTFSLGLDSGVGAPYMQFQAWNSWGFFHILYGEGWNVTLIKSLHCYYIVIIYDVV